ncbi:hypothetical protein WMO24_00425 [Ruthenibacterium sp. CLA-JM-H11]|uniref:Lipoprotein n=1 Tax=Ruthenibacterium intestinale TaxID=3133163 RepID=A0ABV1GAT0_9FIRM
MKKSRKVFFVLLSAVLLTVPAFADSNEVILRRGVACMNCDRGSMIPITRMEDEIFAGPCQHNHPGYQDFLVTTHKRQYQECNNCGVVYLVSDTITARNFYCGWETGLG